MADLDFAIVDAHMHQWEPRKTWHGPSILARPLGGFPELYLKVGQAVLPKPIRGFLGDPKGVLLPYLPADHARDSAALTVDTVVHVEAGWVAPGLLGPVGETRFANGLDFGPGKRLGAVVAHADLRKPRVGELLDAHAAASPKLRGIRQKAARHTSSSIMAFANVRGLYRDADFLRGFERLAERKLRFDAWCYSDQLTDLNALAQRFPEVPIVLDHLGTPVAAGGQVGDVGRSEDERESIRARWRDGLARVAEHKHVHAKLSGLAMPVLGFGFHTRAQPPTVDELVERFGPFVNHALDQFGVERCFFASNFPMDRPSAPFERIFAAFTELAWERGRQAPRALLRDNALRFYGI